MFIIDSHIHLWIKQNGKINGKSIFVICDGKANVMGETIQMLPPYMIDNKNTAEIFISNMNYTGVSGAVVTQEYLDGDQNDYLLSVKSKYPNQFKICGLPEVRKPGYFETVKTLIELGFDGIKIPAQRLVDLPKRIYLNNHEMMQCFSLMESRNLFVN